MPVYEAMSRYRPESLEFERLLGVRLALVPNDDALDVALERAGATFCWRFETPLAPRRVREAARTLLDGETLARTLRQVG